MAALLELADVSKAFGRVVVADHLSLTLEAGTALGVVGPNGAGKTSLLNLITGNIAPDSGQILLDGSDITRLPTHARSRLGIGRTHQVPQPFGGLTVLENVLVGADHAGTRRAAGVSALQASVDAIEVTGLLPKVNTLASTLSLLERKRLELARALATAPRLMLLDEVAGGLTEHEVADLIETIRRLLAAGLTVVWIEHIVHALLSVVGRLIALDYGRALADGDPRVVMASAEVQAVYMGQEIVA